LFLVPIGQEGEVADEHQNDVQKSPHHVPPWRMNGSGEIPNPVVDIENSLAFIHDCLRIHIQMQDH
ncbi:hypothetical protein KKB10_03890, partial [Patescibacteria group bacterium]|nr:hypothetical protein [Patescibacteria group bacterium]